MNRDHVSLNTLGLFGMTLVLLIGFVLQFALNELLPALSPSAHRFYHGDVWFLAQRKIRP